MICSVGDSSMTYCHFKCLRFRQGESFVNKFLQVAHSLCVRHPGPRPARGACRLGTHPLGVRSAAAAEGGEGAALDILDALCVEVSAGALAGGRADRAGHHQRGQRGPHLGHGAEVGVLDQLADLLHPNMLDIQVIGFQNNLR